MRELKFRQAIKARGVLPFQWRYWGYIYPDSPSLFEPPLGNVEWDERPSYQFTGLKDSNSKEVYEGNVVRFRESSFDEWSTRTIRYFGDRNYPAFDVFPEIDADSNGLSYIMACCEIEVIGDIEEHPELLK